MSQVIRKSITYNLTTFFFGLIRQWKALKQSLKTNKGINKVLVSISYHWLLQINKDRKYKKNKNRQFSKNL